MAEPSFTFLAERYEQGKGLLLPPPPLPAPIGIGIASFWFGNGPILFPCLTCCSCLCISRQTLGDILTILTRHTHLPRVHHCFACTHPHYAPILSLPPIWGLVNNLWQIFVTCCTVSYYAPSVVACVLCYHRSLLTCISDNKSHPPGALQRNFWFGKKTSQKSRGCVANGPGGVQGGGG